MQKQRLVYNNFLGLRKSTLDAQRAISRQPRKKKTKLVKSIKIGIQTKTRLSLITPFQLSQINLKPIPTRKVNVIEVAKGAIQPLGLMLLRLPRKTMIRLKTCTTSSTILTNKKTTIPLSVPKRQKISYNLDDLHVND